MRPSATLSVLRFCFESALCAGQFGGDDPVTGRLESPFQPREGITGHLPGGPACLCRGRPCIAGAVA